MFTRDRTLDLMFGMREQILLAVEDNDADFLILQLALRDLDIPHKIYRVYDGEEGLEFLQHAGCYANAPRPDLVITNVEMPRKTGLELLVEMQADAELACIPVLMFTSARNPNARRTALELGAREYISKPLALDEFVEAIKTACVRLLAHQNAAGAG